MNKIGNWIIHELKDGTTLTFETTELEPDWRDSFAIRLIKIENKKGLRTIEYTNDDLINVYDFHIRTLNRKYDRVGMFGVIKLTTIDYLNLQRLGFSNYTTTLRKMIDVSPRTLQTRLRLSREKGWLPKVPSGTKIMKEVR